MIECPRCQNTQFQEIRLGELSYNDNKFVMAPQLSVFVCAQCGYRIASEADLMPQVINLFITGNADAYKRKALRECGYSDQELKRWNEAVLRLDTDWFITKKDYEQKRLDIPAGYLVKTNFLI